MLGYGTILLRLRAPDLRNNDTGVWLVAEMNLARDDENLEDSFHIWWWKNMIAINIYRFISIDSSFST